MIRVEQRPIPAPIDIDHGPGSWHVGSLPSGVAVMFQKPGTTTTYILSEQSARQLAEDLLAALREGSKI